jgi:hypothetical protein
MNIFDPWHQFFCRTLAAGPHKRLKSSESFEIIPIKDGAGDRDRTGDIQLGKLAFYR